MRMRQAELENGVAIAPEIQQMAQLTEKHLGVESIITSQKKYFLKRLQNKRNNRSRKEVGELIRSSVT